MKHTTQFTPEAHEVVESWHHHTLDEGEPQEEHAGRVDTKALGLVFTSVVIFFIVTATATILYFIRYTTNLRQERIESADWAREFTKRNENEQKALQEFAWADPAAGTVQVPIDMARERVIAKYAK